MAGLGDPAYQPKFEGQHAYWVQGEHEHRCSTASRPTTPTATSSSSRPGTDGLLVRNSTFSRNGRQGWTINGSNITFDHNTIGETRRATVDLEPTLRQLGRRTT